VTLKCLKKNISNYWNTDLYFENRERTFLTFYYFFINPFEVNWIHLKLKNVNIQLLKIAWSNTEKAAKWIENRIHDEFKFVFRILIACVNRSVHWKWNWIFYTIGSCHFRHLTVFLRRYGVHTITKIYVLHSTLRNVYRAYNICHVFVNSYVHNKMTIFFNIVYCIISLNYLLSGVIVLFRFIFFSR